MSAKNSHRRCSIKNVLKMQPEVFNFLKRRLQHRCFPVNFAKFLRAPFLQNTSGRLLLVKNFWWCFFTTLWKLFCFSWSFYIYIYIYMCVCVGESWFSKTRQNWKWLKTGIINNPWGRGWYSKWWRIHDLVNLVFTELILKYISPALVFICTST